MFAARPKLQYKPPIQGKKELPSYTGISQYVSCFEKGPPPPPTVFVPPAERKEKLKEKLTTLHNEKNELLAADWDPHSNPKATE